MIADEIWISVEVFGPQADIDRFKAVTLPVPPEDGHESSHDNELDFISPTSDGSGSAGEVLYEPCDIFWDSWNFREREQSEQGTYKFGFDTRARFPIEDFENLAKMFPTLAFHCECIASMDEFMGFGWFNAPDGGEKFDFCDVPTDYWTCRGIKRDEAAQLRHRALVAKVTRAAREASEFSAELRHRAP